MSMFMGEPLRWKVHPRENMTDHYQPPAHLTLGLCWKYPAYAVTDPSWAHATF